MEIPQAVVGGCALNSLLLTFLTHFLLSVLCHHFHLSVGKRSSTLNASLLACSCPLLAFMLHFLFGTVFALHASREWACESTRLSLWRLLPASNPTDSSYLIIVPPKPSLILNKSGRELTNPGRRCPGDIPDSSFRRPACHVPWAPWSFTVYLLVSLESIIFDAINDSLAHYLSLFYSPGTLALFVRVGGILLEHFLDCLIIHHH